MLHSMATLTRVAATVCAILCGVTHELQARVSAVFPQSEDSKMYREGGLHGPQSYSGVIVFNDGSRIRFNWLSSASTTSSGPDIEEGKGPFSYTLDSQPTKRDLQFDSIARIDFL